MVTEVVTLDTDDPDPDPVTEEEPVGAAALVGAEVTVAEPEGEVAATLDWLALPAGEEELLLPLAVLVPLAAEAPPTSCSLFAK